MLTGKCNRNGCAAGGQPFPCGGALAVQQRRGYKVGRQDIGVWLSLVEHLVRDEGVAGSNPATPTNNIGHFSKFTSFGIDHADRYADRNGRVFFCHPPPDC
jgi:hypothetical protein